MSTIIFFQEKKLAESKLKDFSKTAIFWNSWLQKKNQFMPLEQISMSLFSNGLTLKSLVRFLQISNQNIWNHCIPVAIQKKPFNS